MSVVVGDRGFGLVEAVVSLAILALVATTILDVVTSAAVRRTLADKRLDALLDARGILASVGADAPIAPGRFTAHAADGSEWNIEVTPSSENPRLFVIAVLPTGVGHPVLTALRLGNLVQ